MAYFLVEGLGREPWVIGVYSTVSVLLSVGVNRAFGRRIDTGLPVFPLVGLAACATLAASISLALVPSVAVVLTIGILGFGIGSSAIATMFSLGGAQAERRGIDRTRTNAWMRATTSTGWMAAPAAAFVVAERFGNASVFVLSAALACLWLALWWRVQPHDLTVPAPPAAPGTADASRALWMAAAFILCLSTAHSLTFSALPLFYVQEVGLPGYAPGLAFSVKTAVEVVVIFASPLLVARLGLKSSLLVTTALAICAILYLASVETFAQMIAGAAFEGLYYGLYASIGISFIQSRAPDRPAQATALYWNTLKISGLSAGAMAGLVAQVADFRSVILLAAGVAALAFVVLLAVDRRERARA